MSSDFRPVPSGAKRPPGPDYGAQGENKSDRDPPGGYLGANQGNQPYPPNEPYPPFGQGGGIGASGGGTGPVEPDPIEPDYSADQWDYIHYAAKSPSGLADQIRSGSNIDARTSLARYTPLHIAVKFGQPDAVRQLIAARAHLDLVDCLGQTPLSLACCYNVGIEIPRMLLDAGANTEVVDGYSWRPIFWAASKGYYDLVKLLVERRARTQDRDKRGKRPCEVATDGRIRALLD